MTTTADTQKLMTADELLHLPDDGCRHELVDGYLVHDQLPGHEHGGVSANLTALLHAWARREHAGSVVTGDAGFHLRSDPDTVRGPDVAFVAAGRYGDAGRPDGYLQGAPDVAAEVVSPTDRMVDVLAKVRDYLDAGAQQVWVVEPQSRTLTIHKSLQDLQVLTEADILVGTGPVDGLELRVAEVFE